MTIARPNNLFHIKICGVRFLRDVEAVAKAGADAVGLNFYEKSVRFLDPNARETRELADFARSLKLTTIGVFANKPVVDVTAISDALNLDAIQLHGSESVEEAQILQSKSLNIVRAVALPNAEDPIKNSKDDASHIQELTAPWLETGCQILFDADKGRDYSGSGLIHWPSVRGWAENNATDRWSLAGGLNPNNVAQAIRFSGACSIDTASGVEKPKGTKSAALIREFVQNAKAAFAERNS